MRNDTYTLEQHLGDTGTLCEPRKQFKSNVGTTSRATSEQRQEQRRNNVKSNVGSNVGNNVGNNVGDNIGNNAGNIAWYTRVQKDDTEATIDTRIQRSGRCYGR